MNAIEVWELIDRPRSKLPHGLGYVFWPNKDRGDTWMFWLDLALGNKEHSVGYNMAYEAAMEMLEARRGL